MMAVVRAAALGVSSTSTAQHCSGNGLSGTSGHQTSASGTWPVPGPPLADLIRRSLRHHPAPARYSALVSSAIRVARTARIWASRASGGRRAGNRSPAACIPARVSQHQPGPGPIRPDSASPAVRHRAMIARSRSGRTPSAAARRSYGAAYMSPASISPAASRAVNRTAPASDRRGACAGNAWSRSAAIGHPSLSLARALGLRSSVAAVLDGEIALFLMVCGMPTGGRVPGGGGLHPARNCLPAAGPVKGSQDPSGRTGPGTARCHARTGC